MAPSLQLFRRTRQLEKQIDSFFDKLSESSVVYRLAVRVYLKEGANEEFEERLVRVNKLESEADDLRRDIETQLYSNTLIPDSRGDVLGLIETVDQLLTQFEGSLWAFSIEKPDIPEELRPGFKKLTNMVVKAADELGLGARAFFRSPHDVPAYNHKVQLYEKEADIISTALKRDIFDSELELPRKLHLREFVEAIDGIADLAEDVADRLAIYSIKRTV
ncbi:Phosphate transport regulator (distant homolog of PhoU) [hydrothermal vent metagenome]|uniref:Phosphate transport regulator (Distant homolog of PhoU) n=1 Tax=hydrothermal vent metagenome TaxID=652676 RepID=A0A3B0RSJ9_9ZZZZ